MTYDAIILAYRRDALRCVAAVAKQDPAPGKIIVWHNHPSSERIDGVVNIVADENFKCRARHAVGMLSTADICVFVDDDVILNQSDACGLLVAGAGKHFNSVVGYTGRRCTGVSKAMYWGKGEAFRGKEGPVSVVKGRFHAVRRILLPIAFRNDLPEAVWSEDDIVLSASLQMHLDEPSWVIGGFKRGGVTDVTDDLGNEKVPGHFERRNAACNYFVGLGWNPTRWTTQ